jgi:hypothetical protein
LREKVAPRSLTRWQKRALGGAAAVALLLVGALASRQFRRLGKTNPIVINLDHGLADCPWPKGVDRLDPVGRVRVENRTVVIRTDARVYFTENVEALTCLSAYDLGPVVMLELGPTDPGGYPPPPLDAKLKRDPRDDLAKALAAYRVARQRVDDFALSPELADRARRSLDEWYAGDHQSNAGASLGFVGTLATGSVEIGLFQDDVVVSFAFAADALPITPWSPAPGGKRRICIHTPVDGGPAWVQPPPYTPEEIARSPFKLCPPSKWGK